MARNAYANFKFEVESGGFPTAGFQKVTGLEATVEPIEYREGGDNTSPRKQAGQTTFNDVTFERGVASDSDFINWMKRVFDVDSANGDSEELYRETITVYLKNKAGARVKKWTLFNCFPISKSTGDLDASGNDVLIETLVVATEGIKEETLG